MSAETSHSGGGELADMGMDLITITELGENEVLYTYTESADNLAANRISREPHVGHLSSSS
jgi:hypothetical protein